MPFLSPNQKTLAISRYCLDSVLFRYENIQKLPIDIKRSLDGQLYTTRPVEFFNVIHMHAQGTLSLTIINVCLMFPIY